MPYQELKLYQAGTFVVGNRLLDPEQRSVQARIGPLQHPHLRAPGLPGLRRGARRPLRARRGDAGDRRPADRRQRDRLPRGLLDALPESSWQLPWIHSLFGNAPAVATGVAAALKVEGPRRRAGGRPGRRRRHRRHRLRLPLGDVRAKRRRALHLLRQRGLHEHRRAALGRDAAGRAHREHEAGRRGARQRLRPGQERAADRDGARDPLRGDGDRRRAARPRGQGRAGDGVPRRPLPARLRPLPARLGLGLARHDPARPAGQGDGAVPGLRGRARRGGGRLEDPPAGCRSRST